jgi:hypothetical protein
MLPTGICYDIMTVEEYIMNPANTKSYSVLSGDVRTVM